MSDKVKTVMFITDFVGDIVACTYILHLHNAIHHIWIWSNHYTIIFYYTQFGIHFIAVGHKL